MRLPALLLVLAAGFVPLVAPAVAFAQSDPGTVGIRLLDAPVDRRDDPRAQTAIVDHLPALAEIERRIEISNTTDSPQPVQLYAAGADATDGGWEVFDAREQNELTRMVTVTPSEVLVEPGGTEQATVTLQVPAAATQNEQYGVIWAELAPSEGSPVTVVNRVGVRMYVSIGTGDEPASDFEVSTLTAGRDADGSPVVRAEVTNTGGRALDLGGELQLTDGPGGLSAGPFATTGLSTLGIGDSAPVTVVLDPALPAGPWTATMTVRSGTLERVVDAELTFPDEPDQLAEPVEARPVRPGGPIGPIVAGLFVLVTGLLALLAWRRRRDEDDETEEPDRVASQPPGADG